MRYKVVNTFDNPAPGAKCGTRCQITAKVSSDAKFEAEPRGAGLRKGPQG